MRSSVEEYRKRRKRPYGESHPYNAFIPKRFEDLKLNGGTRFRRIPIKKNYHRSRFKKLESKSPRRALDSKGWLDLTGLATSQRRCVRVKTVRMKKQYHQKKRIAQVKLAQACKSLGMFLDSPSFRDPKDCTKICVVKRQIIDAGVRRETHLFWYEFTSHEPTEIDCHVDTRIGDQSIFAEEVIALEHDDNADAMESVKDETVLESEPEVTSNYKIRVELSQFQQQKEQRRFHKLWFKGRRHRRALYTERLVLQKKHSVNWSYHKTRKKELISLNISAKALRQLDKGSVGKNASGRNMELPDGGRKKRSCVVSHSNHLWKPGRLSKKAPPLWSFVDDSLKGMNVIRCSVAHLLNGVEYCDELVPVRELGVWDPVVTCQENSPQDELGQIHYWRNGLRIIKLHMRHGFGFTSFRFSRSVKMWVWWFMKTSLRKQLCEFYSAIQVWEPGGISTRDRAYRLLKKVRKSNFHGISQEFSQVMKPGTLGEECVSSGSLSGFAYKDCEADLFAVKSPNFTAMILKKELRLANAQNTELNCATELVKNRLISHNAVAVSRESNVIHARLGILRRFVLVKGNKYNMVESCLKKQLATRDEPLFSVGSMNHCGDDYKLNKILEARTMFKSNPKKKNEMDGSVRSEYVRREKQLGILIRNVCYEEGNSSATTRKLTMVFSGYDWFQPPRPPEQLVVVLGIVSEEATTYAFRPELISDVNPVPTTKDYNTVSRIKKLDTAFVLVHLRTSGISGGGVLISIDVRTVEAFILMEVMRNKTGKDGCSRRAWNNERCVMGCGNRDLPTQLFGTEFATFWPMFEFLSAVLEANFMAFINTKGVRVTGSQTCDLFEGSHAMKIAITSLSILQMQVIFRWTFNFINDWFQSPRPPGNMSSVQVESSINLQE